MSMLSLSLNEVHQQIPEEILSFVFMEMDKNNYYLPVNLDAKIIEEVINKRVMPDLNVEYAVRLNIPLSSCDVNMISPSDWVVAVPPELTGNRKIITILGVNYNNTLYSSGFEYENNRSSPIITAGFKMANGTGGVPSNYEVKCEMISSCSFRIRRSGYIGTNCLVELIVENDPQLNNIPITAASYIKKLIVLATKAHIYRKAKIRIGRAYLDGGSELGEFKEIIDSYSDANDMYLEELSYASRIQWMASEEMKYDYMRMIISNIL